MKANRLNTVLSISADIAVEPVVRSQSWPRMGTAPQHQEDPPMSLNWLTR